MNKNILTSFLIALLLLTGCDYNDKYFKELDDLEITQVVDFEGEYTGDYPEEGYFTDRTTLETAVAAMLKSIFPYADEGTASISSILYGEITPGFETTDVKYELEDDDYDAMGEEPGQPGYYNNFDSTMEVESYLLGFLNTNYADLEAGQTIAITYKYYSGGNTNVTVCYERTSDGWKSIEIDAFTADINYTLETEDYQSMGTGTDQPGQYNNFSSSIDPDYYLPIFLGIKFPYVEVGTTAEISYLFYSGSTSIVSSLYKYNGSVWSAYDPYADTLEVMSMTAVMRTDGENWTLQRLMGGSVTYTMGQEDMEIMYSWVEENITGAAYFNSSRREEYYLGSSPAYGNITHSYTYWRNADEALSGYTNAEIQELQDERMAWAITTLILPYAYPEPDSGLTYIVIYPVYGGRGTADYKMSFIYNEETGEFEFISGPSKA